MATYMLESLRKQEQSTHKAGCLRNPNSPWWNLKVLSWMSAEYSSCSNDINMLSTKKEGEAGLLFLGPLYLGHLGRMLPTLEDCLPTSFNGLLEMP